MELEEVLRRRGGRLTRPRELVWRALGDVHGHVTVQELADLVAAEDPSINMSSVYRTLELFDELGLVRESRTNAQDAATWERRHPDGEIHLVCVDCGGVLHHRTGVIDRLRDEIARAGFAPEAIDVSVSGSCGCIGRPESSD